MPIEWLSNADTEILLTVLATAGLFLTRSIVSHCSATDRLLNNNNKRRYLFLFSVLLDSIMALSGSVLFLFNSNSSYRGSLPCRCQKGKELQFCSTCAMAVRSREENRGRTRRQFHLHWVISSVLFSFSFSFRIS